MLVTDRDFRPVWSAQPKFKPGVSAINVHFGIRRVEKHIVVRKESRVAIIPTAKFGIASLDVAEVRLRQLHCYVVIVEIPECVTINREGRVFANGLFVMQGLYTAVGLTSR